MPGIDAGLEILSPEAMESETASPGLEIASGFQQETHGVLSMAFPMASLSVLEFENILRDRIEPSLPDSG